MATTLVIALIALAAVLLGSVLSLRIVEQRFERRIPFFTRRSGTVGSKPMPIPTPDPPAAAPVNGSNSSKRSA